jgi:hypothetical protein
MPFGYAHYSPSLPAAPVPDSATSTAPDPAASFPAALATWTRQFKEHSAEAEALRKELRASQADATVAQQNAAVERARGEAISALQQLEDQKLAWRESATMRARFHGETAMALEGTQAVAAIQHSEQWERVSAASVGLAHNAATRTATTENFALLEEERGRLDEQRGIMYEESGARRSAALAAEERGRADGLRQAAQDLARDQWEETNRREASGLRVEELERRLTWETEKHASERAAREGWEVEHRLRSDREREMQQEHDLRREKLELQLQGQLELERAHHRSAHAKLVEQFKAPIMIDVVRELEPTQSGQVLKAHIVQDFAAVATLDDTGDTELSVSVDIGDVETRWPPRDVDRLPLTAIAIDGAAADPDVNAGKRRSGKEPMAGADGKEVISKAQASTESGGDGRSYSDDNEDAFDDDKEDEMSYGRFSRASFASRSGGEWDDEKVEAEGDAWGTEEDEEYEQGAEPEPSPELSRHLALLEKQKVELQARTQLQLQVSFNPNAHRPSC